MSSYLRQRLPWLNDEQEAKLRRLILERAARLAEQGQIWDRAAACRADLGQHEEAARLYLLAGNRRLAAESCLDAARFRQALDHYLAWAAELPPDDTVNQLAAQLGQTACYLLPEEMDAPDPTLPTAVGHKRTVVLLAQLDALPESTPLLTARCWLAFAAFAHRVWRYDFLEEGYYHALRLLAAAGATAERTAALRAYLAAVRDWGDRLRIAELEQELAQSESLAEQPAWWVSREQIERHPFRDGVRDVLHFTHDEQWAAWQTLAKLEDSPEVDGYLRQLAPPEMVYIPSGTFLMGSGDNDPLAYGDEKPQHELWLGGYYIDKYPVTHAHFHRFIEAGGYANESYWSEAIAAGRWRNGQYVDWSSGERSQPEYWNDERFNGERQPVVGVSWYEAVAYARWAGKALPSEAHWEKAASWDPQRQQKRIYPWGDEWDGDKGNFGGKHDRTTDVGAYPTDSSAYGLLDVAGNVLEWCSTRWRDENGADYRYPYNGQDGREELSGGDAVWRVYKGTGWYLGSGNDGQRRVRCGFRNWGSPRIGDYYRGFRCLVPTHAFLAF